MASGNLEKVMGVHSFEVMLISRYFPKRVISNYFQQPKACFVHTVAKQVRCQLRCCLKGQLDQKCHYLLMLMSFKPVELSFSVENERFFG